MKKITEHDEIKTVIENAEINQNHKKSQKNLKTIMQIMENTQKNRKFRKSQKM